MVGAWNVLKRIHKSRGDKLLKGEFISVQLPRLCSPHGLFHCRALFSASSHRHGALPNAAGCPIMFLSVERGENGLSNETNCGTITQLIWVHRLRYRCNHSVMLCSRYSPHFHSINLPLWLRKNVSVGWLAFNWSNNEDRCSIVDRSFIDFSEMRKNIRTYLKIFRIKIVVKLSVYYKIRGEKLFIYLAHVSIFPQTNASTFIAQNVLFMFVKPIIITGTRWK